MVLGLTFVLVVVEPEPSVKVMHINSYLSMNCNLYGCNFGKEFLLEKIPYCSLSLNARDSITYILYFSYDDIHKCFKVVWGVGE